MYDKSYMGFKFEQKRAKNFVRQYYTLSQSMSTVNKLEPDILIRIRDDAMIKQTLDWMSLLKFIEMSDKNIITHACNSWGGINDKFAIVSKNAISTYLSTPLEVYNTYKKGDLGPGRFINPEQFLSKMYVKEGLSLLVYNFQLKIKNQPDAGSYKHNGVRHRHLLVALLTICYKKIHSTCIHQTCSTFQRRNTLVDLQYYQEILDLVFKTITFYNPFVIFLFSTFLLLLPFQPSHLKSVSANSHKTHHLTLHSQKYE